MNMKIRALETVRIAERPNILWLIVHTDEGVTGLGETFFGAATVETHVHEWIAPRVIGSDPLQIDRLAADLVGYLGFRASGAETRGNSAFDIALWDLWGRATGQPVAQLLGGFTRQSIRTYNTCAGTEYIKKATGQTTANYGLDAAADYDDLNGFLHRADELAHSLLEEGITAMKIWPFDAAAEASRGAYISGPGLRAALAPFEKIRTAVGDRMDIMVEFHSMWQLPPAMQIARALAPYGTFWHEDPIRMDSLASLKRYAEASIAPICASETLASRWAFRDLLETGAAGIVMLDLSWCGGLSEARKIAAMAEAWHLPVAPHDCTGPVVLCASTHLSLNAPNALVQESVRAFYRTWYRDLVTALPEVRDGFITVPPGPGLGMELHPDLDRAFTTTRRISDASSF
jgi:galactonate dehydratase